LHIAFYLKNLPLNIKLFRRINLPFINRTQVNNKLQEIGGKLEQFEGLEYAINISYVSTLRGFLYTFVFSPFDRLLLKDTFWGFLKVGLVVLIIYLYISMKHTYLPPLALLLFFIWQFLDYITIFWRVKRTNYKTLMKVIKEKGQLKSTLIIEETEPSEIQKWMKNNPNSSVNDYYRLKK